MNLKNDFSANAEAICNQCVDARKKRINSIRSMMEKNQSQSYQLNLVFGKD